MDARNILPEPLENSNLIPLEIPIPACSDLLFTPSALEENKDFVPLTTPSKTSMEQLLPSSYLMLLLLP